MSAQDFNNLVSFIQYITWPGAAAFIVWVLKPVWLSIAERINLLNEHKHSNMQESIEDRIHELEGFKFAAETNHFHDLEDLKTDRRDVWDAIAEIRRDFKDFQLNIEGRLSRLEAKQNNNH